MSLHAEAKAAPALTPADAFARLSRHADVFWLDSSLPRASDGRHSIMGVAPRWVFTARGNQWHVRYAHGGAESNAAGPGHAPVSPHEADSLAPLEHLDALLNAHSASAPSNAPDLPFCGGAVGWLSYDLGRRFEALPSHATDDLRLPEIHLAWYDAAIVWDHAAGAAWFVGVDGSRSAAEAIADLAGRVETPPPRSTEPRPPRNGTARSDLSRDGYMARVAAVREGIARGEYYQLNLVQRFDCAHAESPADTYLRLRAANPAPFAAFIAAAECAVLSSSPERFIEVTPAGRVRTCPIKGTRPRGVTPADDERLERELLASTKERAELLMIVDLLRNDLGRVCTPGSVQVARLHALESYASVHHLVGEVQGQLRPAVGRRDLLRAVFPGGSITGAPKVSAMRAIETLEPHRRGIGMGSIGYFSAHGRIDLNIAIRTIICTGGRAYVPVGAGIVWDSDPATEYAETLIKARPLFAALGVTSIEP